MKKMTSLLLMLCVAIISQAQTNKGKITGHVQDGNQKLVESATITLLKSTDSSGLNIICFFGSTLSI